MENSLRSTLNPLKYLRIETDTSPWKQAFIVYSQSWRINTTLEPLTQIYWCMFYALDLHIISHNLINYWSNFVKFEFFFSLTCLSFLDRGSTPDQNSYVLLYNTLRVTAGTLNVPSKIVVAFRWLCHGLLRGFKWNWKPIKVIVWNQIIKLQFISGPNMI